MSLFKINNFINNNYPIIVVLISNPREINKVNISLSRQFLWKEFIKFGKMIH